jgi:hypothetical protein
MHCGTYIVRESWQCQLTRARAATDSFFRLEHDYGSSRASENDCGSQTVRSGPDYNAIVFASLSQGVALSYDGRGRWHQLAIPDVLS